MASKRREKKKRQREKARECERRRKNMINEYYDAQKKMIRCSAVATASGKIGFRRVCLLAIEKLKQMNASFSSSHKCLHTKNIYFH